MLKNALSRANSASQKISFVCDYYIFQNNAVRLAVLRMKVLSRRTVDVISIPEFKGFAPQCS